MNQTSRREFLSTAAKLSLTAGPLSCLPASVGAAVTRRGTADSCIMLWLGGGACHLDTFDPKVKGDAPSQRAGSYYDSIPTAIEGVEVCEHLPRIAKLLDRTILVRSVHHDVIDEHAAAVNRVHTGRPPTGTTTYPSIGSVVAHELGARGEEVPAYVVMADPRGTPKSISQGGSGNP